MADRRVKPEMPHDLDLERGALGAALLGAAAELRDEGLTLEVFYRQAHRLVWDACVGLLDDGVTPELHTVAVELTRRGTLGDVDLAYLSTLIDGVPKRSGANLLWMVAKLEEYAATRVMLEATGELARVLRENPEALADGTVAKQMDALEEARQGTVRTSPWLTSEGQWESLRQEAKRSAEGSVSLGIPELDQIIDGIRPGEVFGYMARPGIGKTVLLCQFARAMAHACDPHGFFSLEMPAAQIVTRLVQAEYELTRPQVLGLIRTGQLDQQRYQELFSTLALVHEGGLSVTDMSQRLRRMQDRLFKLRSIRAVTIDHAGLIGGDTRLSTYDRVSMHARQIKELAKRHQVAVILAIQVNRDGGDGSKELHLGSARDSGVIEEAMDYLVGVRRFDRSTELSDVDREIYKDTLFLKVIKSRHGTPGKEIAVQFDSTLDVRPSLLPVPPSVGQAKLGRF